MMSLVHQADGTIIININAARGQVAQAVHALRRSCGKKTHLQKMFDDLIWYDVANIVCI